MNEFDDDSDFDPDYFVPKMIDKTLNVSCLKDLPSSVLVRAKELVASGWRFYFVAQQRGRCYRKAKVITLPSWAMKREIQYRTWYICHEMAHTNTFDVHGPKFMAELIRICPADCVKFELGYKPRNATAAGIGVRKYTIDDL